MAKVIVHGVRRVRKSTLMFGRAPGAETLVAWTDLSRVIDARES